MKFRQNNTNIDYRERKKEVKEMQKEEIFDRMNGFLSEGTCSLPGGIVVEDEFADGRECGRLYEEVYQAKLNLCRRLGQEEDKDVETIISNMEAIAKLLSFKMYDYGRAGAGDQPG